MATDPSTGFLAATSAINAIASIGSAYQQAQAARARMDYERRIADINLRFADLSAQDVLRRGEKEAQKVSVRTRQLIGRQRVSLAAQGVSLESGSPLEIQEETAAQGAMDALTIRNNAWREAWGYKVQALNINAQLGLSELAAKTQATSSLLTGGLQASRDIAQGAYYLGEGRRIKR